MELPLSAFPPAFSPPRILQAPPAPHFTWGFTGHECFLPCNTDYIHARSLTQVCSLKEPHLGKSLGLSVGGTGTTTLTLVVATKVPGDQLPAQGLLSRSHPSASQPAPACVQSPKSLPTDKIPLMGQLSQHTLTTPQTTTGGWNYRRC